ncbi:MAG: hypothetical protein O2958_10790 [Gemmatimonadetes bacterium]|nr:hypothetical protein [Gemmatimonadota bacterium]
MSPRKTILRELSQPRTTNGPAYTRPSTIKGFSAAPEKYQKAVNELLQARLVEGRKDDEGHMTIAINEHRLQEVRRELRPVWARPAVWAAIAVLVALGAGLAI